MTATLSPRSTGPTRSRKVRDLRRLQRIIAAVVLLVPGLTAAVSRLFLTDDSDARRALDLVAADPGRQFTFALLGYITMLTIVPAFLAAGRLARRRRPVLTMVAVGVNLIACISGWAVLALDTMYLAGSEAARRAAGRRRRADRRDVGRRPDRSQCDDRGRRPDTRRDLDGSGSQRHNPHRRMGGAGPVPARPHPGLRGERVRSRRPGLGPDGGGLRLLRGDCAADA